VWLDNGAGRINVACGIAPGGSSGWKHKLQFTRGPLNNLGTMHCIQDAICNIRQPATSNNTEES